MKRRRWRQWESFFEERDFFWRETTIKRRTDGLPESAVFGGFSVIFQTFKLSSWNYRDFGNYFFFSLKSTVKFKWPLNDSLCWLSPSPKCPTKCSQIVYWFFDKFGFILRSLKQSAWNFRGRPFHWAFWSCPDDGWWKRWRHSDKAGNLLTHKNRRRLDLLEWKFTLEIAAKHWLWGAQWALLWGFTMRFHYEIHYEIHWQSMIVYDSQSTLADGTKSSFFNLFQSVSICSKTAVMPLIYFAHRPTYRN